MAMFHKYKDDRLASHSHKSNPQSLQIALVPQRRAILAVAVAPAWPADNNKTGMPLRTASSMTWQDSVANLNGVTTKQLLFDTNGRARHFFHHRQPDAAYQKQGPCTQLQ